MWIVTKLVDGQKNYLRRTVYKEWYWVPDAERAHHFRQHLDATYVANAYRGTVETA